MKLTIEITQDYLGSIERGVEIECETVFELENIPEGDSAIRGAQQGLP